MSSNRHVNSMYAVIALPSSCAIFCLWVTEELFQTASSTRLPNLEHAIFTYWPCENKNKWSVHIYRSFLLFSHSYLQPLEDLSSSLVTGSGDEGLQDVAASGVCGQRQQVSGGQGAQTAEQYRAIFESGQRLDQAGAMITDGRQRNLERVRDDAAHWVCSLCATRIMLIIKQIKKPKMVIVEVCVCSPQIIFIQTIHYWLSLKSKELVVSVIKYLYLNSWIKSKHT